MPGMPRLTSYSSPQAPPPTPSTNSSASPFDASLSTLSSKAIGIVPPSTNSISNLSLKDQVRIRVVNQSTGQPAAGLPATLSASNVGELGTLQGGRPFAVFTGTTNSEGQISNWNSQGDSTIKSSDQVVRDTTNSKWFWTLNLESETYWSNLGLETLLPEVVVKFHARSAAENHSSLQWHIAIVLGQWGFTMHERNFMDCDSS